MCEIDYDKFLEKQINEHTKENPTEEEANEEESRLDDIADAKYEEMKEERG